MNDMLEKIKEELWIIFFVGIGSLVVYLGFALLLTIFRHEPTYDHWIPVSAGSLVFVAVWLVAHLDFR